MKKSAKDIRDRAIQSLSDFKKEFKDPLDQRLQGKRNSISATFDESFDPISYQILVGDDQTSRLRNVGDDETSQVRKAITFLISASLSDPGSPLQLLLECTDFLHQDFHQAFCCFFYLLCRFKASNEVPLSLLTWCHAIR